MKKLYLTFLTSLFTTLAFSQLANPDFENWYTDTTGMLTLADWQHFTNQTPSAYGLLSWQDTNAEHGRYALTIARGYMGETNDWVQQKAKFPDGMLIGLQGFYKYTNNQLIHSYDTAVVEVFVTEWNTSTGAEDTIGSNIARLSATDTFREFYCPIDFAEGYPDSIVVNIMPTYLQNGTSSNLCIDGECSFLTIDNLSLIYFSDDVKHFEMQYADIYPNPVSDKLIVRTAKKISSNPFELIITDMLGKVVLKTAILQQITEIDMSRMPPGNYFLVIKNNSGMVQVKRLVKD